MKIKIKIIGHAFDHQDGDVVEIDEKIARLLIEGGRAILIKDISGSKDKMVRKYNRK